MIAIYDHITTFDQEFELVWRKSWSISKLLFLLASVFLSDVSTAEVSKNLITFQGTASTGVVFLVQILMQFRIYAMYNRATWVVAFMVTCFVVEVAAITTFLVYEFSDMQVTVEPAPGVRFCTITSVPTFIFGIWIAFMAFEFVLFSLALYKSAIRLRNVPQGWSGVNLLDVLLRDSILYFFVTFAAYCTNAIVWFALPPGWIEITEAFGLSLTCIMGTHLLLNLRGAYYGKDNSTGRSSTEFSSIGFGSRLRKLQGPRRVAISVTAMETTVEDHEMEGETGETGEEIEMSWRWDQGTGKVGTDSRGASLAETASNMEAV
ncbi:hypothetical protein JAAARDRAFT_36689 [Jaapia argillacea MUCL 33604]|uniref:DUF6533 domain-containing protein n=1 Tax=Jaapia argillacea MUCL 33604 TaxID=933084 RepID=A0A067PM88_9AGAM|nr:hypothetical protein JAAARDRAFT_36689 [Jaapia argillacea MUCL 33604]